MSQSDLTERLYKLDTCAVSDAMDALGIKGAVAGLKPLSVRKKIAGPAVTVKLGPKTEQVSSRHLGTAAIEAASPGDVIVVEHGRSDAAGWGGNLAIAAMQRGISGVIVDGACRDVDEMRELGFPVYAREAVPFTARGRIEERAFNEPIKVADVEVRPGDLVIADGNGIAFIPRSRAEEVIAAAERIVRKETLMAEAIRSGQPVSAVMGKNYETMLENLS